MSCGNFSYQVTHLRIIAADCERDRQGKISFVWDDLEVTKCFARILLMEK